MAQHGLQCNSEPWNLEWVRAGDITVEDDSPVVNTWSDARWGMHIGTSMGYRKGCSSRGLANMAPSVATLSQCGGTEFFISSNRDRESSSMEQVAATIAKYNPNHTLGVKSLNETSTSGFFQIVCSSDKYLLIRQRQVLACGDYLGCFTDYSFSHDLADYSISDPSMDVSWCTTTCGSYGYFYAGLEAGNMCYCGNSFGKYGHSTNCSIPCVGKITDTCGNWNATSVYCSYGCGHRISGRPPKK